MNEQDEVEANRAAPRRLKRRPPKRSGECFRLVTLATGAVIREWDFAADQVDWHDGVEDLFGYAPEAQCRSSEWWINRIHPSDRPRVMNSIDESREKRSTHWESEYRFQRSDSSYAVVADRGRIEYDGKGIAGRLVGCITDISERRAREESMMGLLRQEQEARAEAEAARNRVHFLSDAGEILASSLDYKATLASVADFSVSVVCDWFIVDLREENDVLRRVALAYADPAKAEVAQELRRTPPDLKAASSLADVLTRHQAILWTEPPSELQSLMDRISSADVWRKAVAHGLIPDPAMTSCIIAPIFANDPSLGTLTMISTRPDRVYGQADVAMASTLANRIAVAIRNHELYEEACAAAAQRDELIAIATHDIRTPLLSLQLHLRRMRNVLDRDEATVGWEDDQWRDRLASMSLLGDRLSRMVDELFDLSRLRSQTAPLKLETCDLSEIVRESIALLEHDIVRSGSAVMSDLAAQATGRWDPLHMQRVVTNLIANAVKYGRGNPIEIAVEVDESMTCLEVRDAGVGIAESDKERIFHRFARADYGGDAGSMGLGLYIARQIVEMHGGFLHLTSVPGKGSNFKAVIPRGRLDPPPELGNGESPDETMSDRFPQRDLFMCG